MGYRDRTERLQCKVVSWEIPFANFNEWKPEREAAPEQINKLGRAVQFYLACLDARAEDHVKRKRRIAQCMEAANNLGGLAIVDGVYPTLREMVMSDLLHDLFAHAKMNIHTDRYRHWTGAKYEYRPGCYSLWVEDLNKSWPLQWRFHLSVNLILAKVIVTRSFKGPYLRFMEKLDKLSEQYGLDKVTAPERFDTR